MTKSEILAALAARKKRGRIPGSQVNDWLAGFQAAEEAVKRFMAAPVHADLDPVAVYVAGQKVNTPDAAYLAAFVRAPFNPRAALDATKETA